MRIYISGSFNAQQRLRARADALREQGHDILSTWLYEAQKPSHLNTPYWNRALAEKDLAEVFAADCVILDANTPSTTGGMFVEWGVACAPGSLRLRYTVGTAKRDGVFDSMAHDRFDTWDELLHYFKINHSVR